MNAVSESKERLRAAAKLQASLESVGGMVSVADLALILDSHDALEEALAKANKPRWFYADEEGSPFDSVHEVVEWILDEFGPEDHFPNGKGVLPIETARVGPLIYAAVRCRRITEAERAGGRKGDFVFEVTECATEAEAWALLKEADQ
jgi:hypothetical protein